MERAVPCIRSVIIEDQVIYALHLIESNDRLPDFLRQFNIIFLSENPGDRVPEHLYAGFNDDQGDDCAKPGLQ